MPLPRHVSVVANEASLAGPSPLAAYLPCALLEAPSAGELIARALAPVQNRAAGAAAFVVGDAPATPAIAVNGAPIAIERLAAIDAVHAVARAAEAIGSGVLDGAAIVAIDPETGEWALVGLAAGSREDAVQIAQLGEGPTLPVALSRADVDAAGIDLIAPIASRSERAAEMIRAWVSEAALDAVLPIRTASPVLPARSAVHALASICSSIEALATRTLPPFDAPADILSRPFSAARAARPWISGRPRRAAAWSGGADRTTLVVFEEPSGAGRAARQAPGRSLALLSAATRAALIESARGYAARIEEQGATPLVEWCQSISATRHRSHRVRASILAADPNDLRSKLIAVADAAAAGSTTWHTPDGVSFSDHEDAGKTAFLFPGQGAQFVGMFGNLCASMPGLHDWLDRLQATYPATEYCPPAMIVAPPTEGATADDRALIERSLNGISRGAMVTLVGSLALARLVRRAGVHPDAAAGYSNGENTALVMAGAWQIESLDELLGLLHVVRVHDEDHPVERGACIAVNQASADVVERAIAATGGDVSVALENCPDQRVLFGAPSDIARVTKALAAAGAIVIPMAFDRGHHTPRYQDAVERLRPVYRQLEMRAPDIPMYSCVTAAPFPVEPDAIRDLAVSQWARTVRFGATIERMYADGFRTFIEIGPGSTLTGFVRNTLRGRSHLALSTHVARRPGFDQLLLMLGRLYAHGHDVDPAGLADSHLALSSHERRLSPAVEAAATPMSATLPPAAMPDAGERAALIESHFTLMQEFLEQQSRVHDWLVRALARPGAPSPMPGAPPDMMPVDASPLLGDRVTVKPGQLAAIRRFDPLVDLFLRHHTFGPAGQSTESVPTGLPVMPFAASIELVVEAAAHLAGQTGAPVQVRQARGSRWMAADRGVIEVRVEAQLAETSPGRHEVHVQLFDVTGGGPRPSFEAFVPVDEPLPDVAPLRVPPPYADGEAFAAWFNARLFHGSYFRRIISAIAIDDRGVTVRATMPGGDGVVAGRRAALRTSIAMIDTGLQAASMWWAHVNNRDGSAYPYLIERFVQWQPVPAGAEMVITVDAAQSGQTLHADIEFKGADGSRYASIIGLAMRIFKIPDAAADVMFGSTSGGRLSAPVSTAPAARRIEPLPPLLVDKGQGIWLRTIAARTLHADELTVWYALDALDREAALLRWLAAKEVVLDVLASRGISAQARELVTGDAGTVIRVRALSAGSESLGVSMESDGAAWIARLDGAGAAVPGARIQERDLKR